MSVVLRDRYGFTIVELLIVIVVIAILASISVVAYTGMQSRARLSIVTQDMKNISKQLEIFRIDNMRFPENDTEMGDLGLRISGLGNYDTDSAGLANLYYCSNLVTGDYSMGVRVAGSKQSFYAVNGGELVSVSGLINHSSTCQRAGLTSASDPNGWASYGITSGGALTGWLSSN